MDFKQIVDCIFINKQNYHKISKEDKEFNFFIINRKFSRKYPKIANFLNNKNIDKSVALDKWYDFFENQRGIPQWYWGKRSTLKKKSNLKDSDYELLIDKLDLKEHDIDFMYKYNNKELMNYIKRLKKL